MKQGKYWCLALTILAALLFGALIWTGDGRFGGIGWLAVCMAIIAGGIGIHQAVKAEAQELKQSRKVERETLGWGQEQAREGQD